MVIDKNKTDSLYKVGDTPYYIKKWSGRYYSGIDYWQCIVVGAAFLKTYHGWDMNCWIYDVWIPEGIGIRTVYESQLTSAPKDFNRTDKLNKKTLEALSLHGAEFFTKGKTYKYVRAT